MCVLLFCTSFVWNISHCKKELDEILSQMDVGRYVKYPLLFSHCNGTWIFWTDFRKIFQGHVKNWQTYNRQPQENCIIPVNTCYMFRSKRPSWSITYIIFKTQSKMHTRVYLNRESSQIVQSTLNLIIQLVVVQGYTFIRSWYQVPQRDELCRQTPMSNFMEIRPVGAEFFHADGQREGRTDRRTWRR